MSKSSEDDLSPSTADYMASVTKALVGAVPFAGSLLVEIAGTIIPNQRIDRTIKFAHVLEERLHGLEQDQIRAKLADENFTDLTEEAMRQVARSTTDERRQYIATLIANSIRSSDIPHIESRHLLRLLGEINDIEIIWLRFYLHRGMGEDGEFRTKHEAILEPIPAFLSSSRTELDRAALQKSYKTHLVSLGLLTERVQINSKTKLPEYDNSGVLKVTGYEITSLGRLLLAWVGME